jgi:L-fuculose-phosphate aldolase
MYLATIRRELSAAGRRLWERGLVGAGEGNLSVRLEDGSILCTPSGACKGDLSPQDLVRIDAEGVPFEDGSPSSEIRMHLRLYKLRPDCNAVVHAHPLAATGFALAGETVPTELLPEGVAIVGKVALVPFAMPGTDELPDALEPYAQDHQAFLLASHGATTVGASLQEALFRMEVLERVAQIVLHARQIGEPRPLPAGALARLRGTSDQE